jgi:hypothetical protein
MGYSRTSFRLFPLILMMLTLSENPAGKAQGAGQSGPLFKPNNAVSGFFARAPEGRGYFYASLRYLPRVKIAASSIHAGLRGTA